MHHLFMDPEHGSGFKFVQAMLTFMVVLPTLLTVYTITASLEIAGRLRGGKGLFGWIRALPWDEPMVLAVALSLVLLGPGGFGGPFGISMGQGTLPLQEPIAWGTAKRLHADHPFFQGLGILSVSDVRARSSSHQFSPT